MALQVWLPLNKDLINQGLSNISINDTGTAIDNNGKIGKCFKITAEKSLGYTPNFNDKGLSLCGWFKFNQSEINAITSTQTYTSTYNTCTGNLIGNNYYGGIGLIWQTNNIYSSGSLTSITIRSILRTPTFYKMTSGFNVEFDKWIHIILTWDPNTHVLSLYKDGVLFNSVSNIASFTDGVSRVLSINYKGAWGGNPRTPVIPIYENDIRIYDHCLSPKEVKEISKGLVLHYTLDDYSRNTLLPPGVELYDYIEGNGTSTYLNTGINPQVKPRVVADLTFVNSADKDYWGNSAIAGSAYYADFSKYLLMYYRFGSTTSINCGNAVSANTRHIYDVSDNVYLDGTLIKTTTNTYTYNSSQSTILIFKAARSNYYSDYKLHDFKLYDGDALVRHLLPCTYLGEPGMWDTVENKFYKNQGTGQFILGNKITTTYNDNIIYDCSGYLNNGIVTGNLTIVSDSSRYNMATHFNSSSYIRVENRPAEILPKDSITVNVWVKYSTWGNPISCTESGGWNFENGGTGVGIRFPLYILSVGYKTASSGILPTELSNAWHMITGVFNRTQVKIYIDGDLKGTTETNSTNPISYANNYLFISAEARGNYDTPLNSSYVGDKSDLRIYATALSDEDIKELYDTSTIIDNKGNLYGYLFKELSNNLFTLENWNEGGKSNVSYVNRNGSLSIPLNPSNFYYGSGDSRNRLFENKFLPNTLYKFDLWMDTDDVYNTSTELNGYGGINIYYTDGTSASLILKGDITNPDGWKNYKYFSLPNKTIDCIGVYYYLARSVYYRWDSVIIPISNDTKIEKNGTISAGLFRENYDISLMHKGGNSDNNELIEI